MNGCMGIGYPDQSMTTKNKPIVDGMRLLFIETNKTSGLFYLFICTPNGPNGVNLLSLEMGKMPGYFFLHDILVYKSLV